MRKYAAFLLCLFLLFATNTITFGTESNLKSAGKDISTVIKEKNSSNLLANLDKEENQEQHDDNVLIQGSEDAQSDQVESNKPNTPDDAVLVGVTYTAHLQRKGWINEEMNGDVIGVPGSGLQIESINVTSTTDLGLKYGVHVQSYGWQQDKISGEDAGTVGQAKRIEAIWIDLDDDAKETYDVLYSVYVEEFGWLDWAMNGEKTGSEGLSRKIEALMVRIVPKHETANYKVRNLLLEEKRVTYSGHVEKLGWIESEDRSYVGTIGKGLRLEGLQFKGIESELDILHTSHVARIGWSNEQPSSSLCGTTGRGLAVEALRFRLAGENAEYFDIYYRVHVQSIGWMPWTQNGGMSGSTGLGLRVEAVEIRVHPKGLGGIRTNSEEAVLQGDKIGLTYRSHVQSLGWMVDVKNGETSGIVEQNKKMEGFIAYIDNNPWLQVRYSALVSGEGWQKMVSEKELAGSVGKKGRIEAVKFELTGKLSRHFNILYRVYTQESGWLNWSINGNPNGSMGYGENIEALEVMITPIKAKSSNVITNPYREKKIPVVKVTKIYYTTETAGLYSSISGGRILSHVPKSMFLFGKVNEQGWLETDFNEMKGYVNIKNISGHDVYAAGRTIIVNKGHGLTSAFSPGVNYEASRALNNMLSSASSIGLDLNAYSSYRSYSYQKTLFNNYVKKDGRKVAETYSMRPGFSEHQTGLAFDIGGRNSSLWTSESFGRTLEGIWLKENAHKFGFILRYPEKSESITGIKYEPWHFRYVGVELANAIRDSGKTLDEYFDVVSPLYKN